MPRETSVLIAGAVTTMMGVQLFNAWSKPRILQTMPNTAAVVIGASSSLQAFGLGLFYWGVCLLVN